MSAAINVWLEAGVHFVFRARYYEPLIDRIRGLDGRAWDRQRKVWIVPARHAQEVRKIVSDFDLVADDSAAARWDSSRAALASSESLSESVASSFTVEGLAGTLRPFQAAGVEYVTKHRQVIIGDEMGLGKTCQAIASARWFHAWPILVVCPAVLKENWRREILKWLPGTVIDVLSGLSVDRVPTAGWWIVNYDIVHAWGPQLPTPSMIVCDESHYLKNEESRRTKAVMQIAARMHPDSIRLCLSGTPILNRPGELIPQLQILGQLEAFGGRAQFEASFCGKTRVRQRLPGGGSRSIVKLDGATNLAVLNVLLRQRCFIRRQKADVLTELPPKVRSVHWGDSAPELYLREEKHAKQELRERAELLAREMRISLEELTRAQEWVGFCSNQMGMLAKLRRALALAKLPMVVDVAESMLESLDKLVIFGHHRDLTTALVNHFACPSVLGGMTDKRRQEAVDSFQDPDGPRVIVCSIQAAGVGLTLHAASNAIMAELAWTPGILDQAEDRLHRMGQRDSVTAWYTLVPDTIDEMMWNLLERKRGIVDAVTDGAMQSALIREMVSNG